MFDPDANATPVNPLPYTVVILLLAVGGVELFFQAAERGFIGDPNAVGWRLEYARVYGFLDPLFDRMRSSSTYSFSNLLRFVSYSFIHLSLIHALFVMVFIAALGKFIGDICDPIVVLVVFILSALVGALVYSLVLDDPVLLVGGYPGVYGLIGAFTWLIYVSKKNAGESGLQAFQLIGVFMALQLVYKFAFGGSNEWFAEFIGFLVGFVLAIFIGPGGHYRFSNLLSKARNR